MAWTLSDSPSNLVLTNVGNTVELAWTDNTTVSTGYKIKRNGVEITSLSKSAIVYDGNTNSTRNVNDYFVNGTVMGSGKLWEYFIDSSFWNKVSTINVGTETTPSIALSGIGYPCLIVSLNKFDFTNIKELNGIQWIPIINNNVNSSLIFSSDKGITWKAFDNTINDWVTVNINDIVDVRKKGNNPTTVNSLTKTQLELLRNGSSSISVGYYITGISSSNMKNNNYINFNYTNTLNNNQTISTGYNGLTGNVIKYVDSTPPDNQTVTYSVSAYDTVNGESTPVNNTITTLVAPVNNLTATPNGYNIRVSWDTNNSNGYRIYKSSDNSLITDTKNTYYDFISNSEQTIDVYVVAYSVLGESATKRITSNTIPNAPTDLIIAQVSDGFKLDWTDNSQLDSGFKVYERESGGMWELVGTTNDTTITHNPSDNNHLIEYKVCATNNIGDSSEVTWGISVVDSVVLSSVIEDSINKITYNWNLLSGDVTGYRLYITDKNGTQIKDVNTNQYVYDIIGETNHSVYVKAYITSSYGEFMSSNSNSIISKFSPRNNVTSINYDFTTTEDNVNLTIYFNDASDVENGFKLKYKIDNFDEQIVDIPTISSDLHGTTYSYNINVTDVIDSITFSVATYNDIGITEYSNSVLLKTSPVSSLQYAYKYISGNTLIAWEDSIGNNIYKLAYSVNNGDYILLDINTSTQMSSRYKYSASIATSSESIVNFVIYQVINGKLQIPTKLKEFDCSAYSSPKVPSDFRVNWYSDGVARYSWTKNNIDIIGYKIYCSVNNGIETVTTIDCIDNQTEYYYDSPQLINNQDVVRAKIQTLTLVDESVISESIDATYIIVPIVPISNFKKAINDTVITYSWDSLEYVQSYEVHKVINGIDEEYFTLSTDYSFSINYNTMFSIDVYVIVNYYGGKSSVASDTISFCPTTFNSNISTQIKNSNISYNNGFVSTTVKYVRTIQSNQIATLTKTSNVSFIIPSILTATVTYSLKYDGIILDKNYTRMSLNNLNELWLKNTNKELYFVNSATATFNVINSMNLTTSFCDKSTIAKVSTIAVIKNKNVATASQDSMLITNSNLTLISYNVNTVVYITVSTDIAPIFYWFTNKYRLETFINVEIHKTRVACLGDSITAGHPNYWAESGTGNIQSQYEYWLQKRLGDSFEVINKGYGSDTTERCLNRFDRDILSLDAQYVIIQAGTNDLYWAMAENKDNREYLEWKMNVAKDNIITMIKKSLDNGIVPIIGTLIPRTTAQGIYRQALWDFNTWVINYCNSKDDVFYVDFYNAGKDNIPPTPLDEPSIAGNLNPLYDGDSQFDEFGNLTRRGYGVHPSPLGYKIMSEAIPLTLFKALQANAKVYLDAECTVEEGTIESDAYKQVYKLMLHNVDRGRIKTTTRYIKNIGNRPIIYSIYPIKESGVDIKFSINNNEFKDYISGKLDPQGVHKINIQIDVPRFGDIPNAEFNLAMRSFSSVG